MSSTDFVEKVNLEEEMAYEGMEGCVGGKNVTINSHDISKAQIQCHELVAPCEIPQVAHLPDIQNIRQDQEDGFFSQAFKYLSEDDKQAFFDRADPDAGNKKVRCCDVENNKEEQEHVEAAIEDTLPSGDPKCGQLPAKDEKNEARTSSQEESTRKMAGTVKEAITMHGSRETGMATLQGARFHDMKDWYHQTCLELLAIAVEDRSMDELDPLERSLVEDMKELTREYKLHPETLLEQLKGRWQSCSFIRMILNSEFCTKQSMLAAMKNE
ncbi:hypothetical protein OS493_031433 [Desmophyllum pertusum]|uniref:Uncharacterized protein n=1 Tax=Desmophyllum pertusum TaxID=174260 RepID=A0A9W9ZYE0_9CNID|nr:hypothetical protein OS493_031433 [Desmophyllum pertusum]